MFSSGGWFPAQPAQRRKPRWCFSSLLLPLLLHLFFTSSSYFSNPYGHFHRQSCTCSFLCTFFSTPGALLVISSLGVSSHLVTLKYFLLFPPRSSCSRSSYIFFTKSFPRLFFFPSVEQIFSVSKYFLLLPSPLFFSSAVQIFSLFK